MGKRGRPRRDEPYKLVRVNESDWEVLNQYMGRLQQQVRKRLYMRDVIHHIVENFVKKQLGGQP
ncbi:MAG: hypothetical protein B6U97_03520 [Candidatus Altiarchaeales archaeon ex4484_96]|nr:MAG: hypothetical protein B6U97_03520 [Candidatus Altiarchaeales archaeon ex4484_96]